MRRPIKNVIVAVNFSESATDAIETGIAMCKQHKAALHLLQVNRDVTLPYPTGKNALLMDLRLQARRNDEDALELQAKSISQMHDIDCFYHISEGPFAPTVASVAEDFYCDLILLERQTSSSFARLLNSNSAYEVVARTNCPVMIIPGRCTKRRFNSVLFPVWPTQSIQAKLDVSLPIMEENRSRVTLFGSTSTKNRISECAMVNSLMQSVHSIISLTNKEVEKELDPTPRTAKKIIRKAIEKSSDLVVISASVETGLLNFFTRNYTEKMLNDCPVPVLSVR